MMTPHILLVDDSEADHLLFQYALETYDSTICLDTAFDGEEALLRLKDSNYSVDIIFLDINMPRMDGFEFLAAYQTSEYREETDIIILSSSSRAEDQQRCLQDKQVKHVLSKPLEISHCVQVFE